MVLSLAVLLLDESSANLPLSDDGRFARENEAARGGPGDVLPDSVEATRPALPFLENSTTLLSLSIDKSLSSGPGHARPLDLEDPCAAADARLGNRATHQADFERCAAGQPGRIVSGTASAGAAGLDSIEVGGIRK